MTLQDAFCVCVLPFFFCAYQNALASGEPLAPKVVQATLISPGSPPFHLRAAITERADFNEHIDLEIFWASPEKWKRTIRSQDFSQTLIVNGDMVLEDDSDDYFPLGLQTLATAVVGSDSHCGRLETRRSAYD
jgi:hypothetical protein